MKTASTSSDKGLADEAATPFGGVAYATIARWCALSGMGRTSTYRELAAGNLQARKVGRRTLIAVQQGLAWIEAQPAARVGQ